jgi:hypothetical protein
MWSQLIVDEREVDHCMTAVLVASRLGDVGHSVLNECSGKTSIHSEATSEVDEGSDWSDGEAQKAYMSCVR